MKTSTSILVIAVLNVIIAISINIYTINVIRKTDNINSKIVGNQKHKTIEFHNMEFQYLENNCAPITYYLPGIEKINFTSDILIDILLDKITRWNNHQLTDINVSLPDEEIILIHKINKEYRSSYILTTFDNLEKLDNILRSQSDIIE